MNYERDIDESERLTSCYNGYHNLTMESKALSFLDQQSSGSDDDSADDLNWLEDPFVDSLEEPTREIKCECGAWATYGRTCSSQFHQDYCPLYISEIYR